MSTPPATPVAGPLPGTLMVDLSRALAGLHAELGVINNDTAGAPEAGDS